MACLDLIPIKDLYHLWNPVYPYLIRQIEEVYDRRDGDILEVGPFCGAIFALQAAEIGSSFSIAAFPAGMGDFFQEEARRLQGGTLVRVVESDASLSGIGDSSIDLLIFRGALFFPSLFQVGFPAIDRVLKENGVALVGGGFGKYTPREVIEGIAKRSRELNLMAGKVEVSDSEIREKIGSGLLSGNSKIISEGGLWVILRK